jgi:hypothetical protein
MVGEAGAAQGLQLALLLASNRELLNVWARSSSFAYQLEGMFMVSQTATC